MGDFHQILTSLLSTDNNVRQTAEVNQHFSPWSLTGWLAVCSLSTLIIMTVVSIPPHSSLLICEFYDHLFVHPSNNRDRYMCVPKLLLLLNCVMFSSPTKIEF